MNKKVIIGYAIGPIGLGVISLVSLPIITWFYSIEDVGRISMLQVFTNFSILLFCLGLDQCFVREYYESNNRASLLKSVITPSLFLSIIFFILILVIAPTLISKILFDISSFYLSFICSLCFVFALVSRYLGLVMRMQERSIAYSMSQLLPKLLFLIFILISVLVVEQKNIKSLVQIHVLSIFFAFLVFSFNTKKELFLALRESINIKELQKYLIFGFPLIFGGLASWGLNVMDRLFLKYYSSLAELGLYSVTISIAGVVTLFSGIFNTIWTPLVYKWISENNADYKKIDDISNIVLFIICIIILFSSMFSWLIPFFLPKEYIDIRYLIPVCLVGPLFYTLSEITAVGITISRKTKFSMIASFIAMLTSIGLNLLLVPKIGATGAAISTALAFFVFLIARTEFSKLCWRQIDTKKQYFNCLLLLIFSIIFALKILDFWLILIISVILLLFIIYLFQEVFRFLVGWSLSIFIGKK